MAMLPLFTVAEVHLGSDPLADAPALPLQPAVRGPLHHVYQLCRWTHAQPSGLKHDVWQLASCHIHMHALCKHARVYQYRYSPGLVMRMHRHTVQ